MCCGGGCLMKALSLSSESVAGFSLSRKFGIVVVAIVIAASMSARSAFAARRHHAAAAASAEEESAASASNPALGAYSEACVVEPTTGTVIFESNDHAPWPTASLAKMMLMLIVAEKIHDGSLKLTDQITTSRKAAEMGGSQVYLKEGEAFWLDDGLHHVVERERLALVEVDLRTAHLGRLARGGYLVGELERAVVDLLGDDQHEHHLGQRRGWPRRM